MSASITSPEQGAQQECKSNFLPSPGNAKVSLTNSLFSIIVCANKNKDNFNQKVAN